MTITSFPEAPCFETTKRLLAGLINEGLVYAVIKGTKEDSQRYLQLRKNGNSSENDCILVQAAPECAIEDRDGEVLPVIQPSMLCPPVIVVDQDIESEMVDAGEIFKLIIPWYEDMASQSVLQEISRHLQNSGSNQETWMRIAASQKILSLQDSSISWERTMICGHPTHPFHRTCDAKPPLKPVKPEDIPAMLTPGITFLSLPSSDLHLAGPFSQLLQPLLQVLEIPDAPEGLTILPCLTQQLPSVIQRFPRAEILKSVDDCVDAQASLRTVTPRPELNFPFHLKLSLACQITSALRTITPWSAQGGPIVTQIMDRFLPPSLWVFKEVASATGSQSDFDEAKHLSCILRENLEIRAEANDEVLIIAAALIQQPHGTSQSYAEILFSLNTVSQKQEWFREYVECLLALVLLPLINHGIGLEAHGQNMLVRICRKTGKIQGFAVRDFGGIRLHTPTLRSQGVNFDAMYPGWSAMTESMEDVWGKVHHSLLQNHVGYLLDALHLQKHGGWAIVRKVLEQVLATLPNTGLYDFYMKDTMPLKCFLRMRMELCRKRRAE